MSGIIYWVRQGDTLSGIALRHGCDVGDLVRTNKLEQGEVLRAGRPLRIPESSAPMCSGAPAYPLDPEDVRVDVEHLTASMKVSKALALSWKSWPGHLAGTARESFSDPGFVITLIVIMGIYAGLWLTPDPTMLTKVLAGALTGVLLAQFAWEDIYGLAKAWFALEAQCARATSVEQLQAAGDTFARKVGQVGFDLLLFIVMWRVGRRMQPRLTEIGLDRALAQAEAQVAVAEAQPGANVFPKAKGEALKVLDVARAQARSAEASHILDVLDKNSSEPARKGLAYLRGQRGDIATLSYMETKLLRGGFELDSFLRHQGVPKPVSHTVKAAVLDAKGAQTRLKMLRSKVLRDPILRRAMSEELSQYMWKVLEAVESPPNWPKVRKAIQARDISGLVGEIGESVQRALLAKDYRAAEGYRIFPNIEHVRLVEGFTRISDWQGVEKAAGRSGEPKGLYEWQGRLWKSITEVDAVIAKKTADGRWRPVELEQMKTGNNDQPIRAHEQNMGAVGALKEIAAGNSNVRLADRVGKHTLGEDLTDKFDLSSLSQLKTATRGTETKGFDRDIPFLREVLEAVATSMVERGLPPKDTAAPPFNQMLRGDKRKSDEQGN